ncbi:MAG: VWA domain-containing protein [Gammaproteobacteria bacterium]|nr:VWA domain-containing protein [Gammaproteobacteria bacterium]MCP5138075.1 VWA domain-containing protein [Gammaproteobacteria bacterium]
MRPRRTLSPFSLSFLDIMFCGFGAVVLLVLILNHDTVQTREKTFTDLRGEVLRLEKEVIAGRANLVEARNSLEATEAERVRMEGEAERVIQKRTDLDVEIARLEQQTLATKAHINELKSDLKTLDTENKRLGAQAEADREEGERLHRVQGDGDRQYLTGLKLGGKRVLILLDASASMLDETVINVILRRNLSEAEQRASPKWKRAQATAEWLISNLPVGGEFQVYAFNTQAEPVIAGRPGWLKTGERGDIEDAIRAVYQRLPRGGTSLYNAFDAVRDMTPQPDNVLLITDGLPTQGKSRPSKTKVTNEERIEHFNDAVKRLPKGVPVNTILFPMEGDAFAAAGYWELAVQSKGAFITPSRDWP